jgi:DNA-binding NarL/FixJ family response regulator
VSAYASWEIADGVLETGASGYVIKVDAGKELAKALVAVFEGKRYISSSCPKSD